MLLILFAIGALVFTWLRRLYGPAVALLPTALIARVGNVIWLYRIEGKG